MKFDTIKLNEIIPSEYNPRIMSSKETEKLSRNLEEFGLVDPIIINLKNNHIIGGHQRYAVLQNRMKKDKKYKSKKFNLIKLGDIGWVFDEEKLQIKDDNHEKALNLALNKISGEWDWTKLDSLFEDLQENHFDLELTGFDEVEIKPVEFNLTDFNEPFDDDDKEEEAYVPRNDSYDDGISEEDEQFLEDELGIDLEEDEDELPDDAEVDIQGKLENRNYTVILSFKTQELANEFILNHFETERVFNKPTQSSIVLAEGRDFEENEIK